MSLSADKIILHVENPEDVTTKLLQLINEFSKLAGYKINRNVLHFYALTTNYPKEKLRK